MVCIKCVCSSYFTLATLVPVSSMLSLSPIKGKVIVNPLGESRLTHW